VDWAGALDDVHAARRRCAAISSGSARARDASAIPFLPGCPSADRCAVSATRWRDDWRRMRHRSPGQLAKTFLVVLLQIAHRSGHPGCLPDIRSRLCEQGKDGRVTRPEIVEDALRTLIRAGQDGRKGKVLLHDALRQT